MLDDAEVAEVVEEVDVVEVAELLTVLHLEAVVGQDGADHLCVVPDVEQHVGVGELVVEPYGSDPRV